MLQLWTSQPPPAEWIRRGQLAHTPRSSTHLNDRQVQKGTEGIRVGKGTHKVGAQRWADMAQVVTARRPKTLLWELQFGLTGTFRNGAPECITAACPHRDALPSTPYGCRYDKQAPAHVHSPSVAPHRLDRLDAQLTVSIALMPS